LKNRLIKQKGSQHCYFAVNHFVRVILYNNYYEFTSGILHKIHFLTAVILHLRASVCTKRGGNIQKRADRTQNGVNSAVYTTLFSCLCPKMSTRKTDVRHTFTSVFLGKLRGYSDFLK